MSQSSAAMTPEAGHCLLRHGKHESWCAVTEWKAHRAGKPALCDCDWLLVLAEACKALGAACKGEVCLN